MCQIIEKEKEENPDETIELDRETHRLREEVKQLLKRRMNRKIKPNLTQQEENGRKKAYRDKDRIYIQADKGKVMVAMDKSISIGRENSYEYKMQKVLQDMKARRSTRANKDWDLTEKISREGRSIVQEMIDKGEITKERGKRLKPSDCRAPRLTGYPKIHKEDVPLRGVVSFIRSPYENIAKGLVPILRSLQGIRAHRMSAEMQKESSRNNIILS